MALLALARCRRGALNLWLSGGRKTTATEISTLVGNLKAGAVSNRGTRVQGGNGGLCSIGRLGQRELTLYVSPLGTDVRTAGDGAGSSRPGSSTARRPCWGRSRIVNYGHRVGPAWGRVENLRSWLGPSSAYFEGPLPCQGGLLSITLTQQGPPDAYSGGPLLSGSARTLPNEVNAKSCVRS